MTKQEHAQFTVYADEAAIPRYQRAWVWGVAALAILLCGLAAGWLFADGDHFYSGRDRRSAIRSVNGDALLAQQEAVNQQLRERISRLERALNRDVCESGALEALAPGTRDP